MLKKYPAYNFAIELFYWYENMLMCLFKSVNESTFKLQRCWKGQSIVAYWKSSKHAMPPSSGIILNGIEVNQCWQDIWVCAIILGCEPNFSYWYLIAKADLSNLSITHPILLSQIITCFCKWLSGPVVRALDSGSNRPNWITMSLIRMKKF